MLGLLFCTPSMAQLDAAQPEPLTQETRPQKVDSAQLERQQNKREIEQQRKREAVAQLRDIQSSLAIKLAERENLQKEIKRAQEGDKEALQGELEDLNAEIELLRKTFEQIAIGGIDLSVFGVKEEKFDWREELVQVVKPLIENIKSLTEKPMKIESLRRVIEDKTLAKRASEEALESIEQLQTATELKIVSNRLLELENDWRSRYEDLEREIQLAEFQLSSLEGKNIRWVEIVKRGFFDFVSGRGLTLLLVVIAAFAVWGLMRGLLWLIRKRSSESADRSSKVRYRAAAYGYRILTALLIAVAVMMVLYFRQDLLLLAIMVVIFIGAALALKTLLPQYIAEGRLLLNMGGVRERERVIYNGLPWEVSSINIRSRFVNPEIRGALRLPIRQMHDMISRPSIDEPWFPSSEGDWILMDEDSPNQVIRQAVDMVELRDVDSVSRLMPTAEYYNAAYPNVSRAEVFRIAIRFGIDYATQKIDPQEIESAFAEAIQKSFADSKFAEHVKDVRAEFHSAGDSSLNYLMLATFEPAAAQYYNSIKRRIQRACVVACNENDWGIPFPQLSVHMPSSEDSKEQAEDGQKAVQEETAADHQESKD